MLWSEPIMNEWSYIIIISIYSPSSLAFLSGFTHSIEMLDILDLHHQVLLRPQDLLDDILAQAFAIFRQSMGDVLEQLLLFFLYLLQLLQIMAVILLDLVVERLKENSIVSLLMLFLPGSIVGLLVLSDFPLTHVVFFVLHFVHCLRIVFKPFYLAF